MDVIKSVTHAGAKPLILKMSNRLGKRDVCSRLPSTNRSGHCEILVLIMLDELATTRNMAAKYFSLLSCSQNPRLLTTLKILTLPMLLKLLFTQTLQPATSKSLPIPSSNPFSSRYVVLFSQKVYYYCIYVRPLTSFLQYGITELVSLHVSAHFVDYSDKVNVELHYKEKYYTYLCRSSWSHIIIKIHNGLDRQ